MSADLLIPKEIPSNQVMRDLSQRYSELDPSAIASALTLLKVAAELHGALSQHFARYNLSHGRFVVLIMLYTTPGGEMCCSDIADAVGVSRATITGLLDGLERDALIKRVDHPEDRRRITVTLTPAGRRLLERILPDHFRKMAGMMSSLSENDRRKMMDLLGRVREGVAALLQP
jgi:DNA-binding MarR family transcriptional regulator